MSNHLEPMGCLIGWYSRFVCFGRSLKGLCLHVLSLSLYCLWNERCPFAKTSCAQKWHWFCRYFPFVFLRFLFFGLKWMLPTLGPCKEVFLKLSIPRSDCVGIHSHNWCHITSRLKVDLINWLHEDHCQALVESELGKWELLRALRWEDCSPNMVSLEERRKLSIYPHYVTRLSLTFMRPI